MSIKKLKPINIDKENCFKKIAGKLKKEMFQLNFKIYLKN